MELISLAIVALFLPFFYGIFFLILLEKTQETTTRRQDYFGVLPDVLP